MSAASNSNSKGGMKFSFFGLVGLVMVALKLKERFDDYKQVSTEEEGAVALHSPADEEDEIGLGTGVTDGLLNTAIAGAQTRKRRRSRKCCVCCGFDCSLFWKAVAVVLVLTLIWNAFKLVRWFLTPGPTGLEGVPEFGTSLGCLAAPYMYTGATTNYTFPVSANTVHALDIRGGAVGSITFDVGAPDSSEIRYEVTVRRDDVNAWDDLVILAKPDESQFFMATPRLNQTTSCMRFDVTVYIPPNLKSVHIASHTVTHVKFIPDAHIELDDLVVTLFSQADQRNLIQPSTHVEALRASYEVWRGWVVGPVSIVESTSIITQRADGVINVHVHPVPSQSEFPSAAVLETIGGAGRTDVVYHAAAGGRHRPIASTHMSGMNGPMYLTYKEADFNGLIDLKVQSYTTTGVQGLMPGKPGEDEGVEPWVGDKEGGDAMTVRSTRGWAGLYF